MQLSNTNINDISWANRVININININIFHRHRQSFLQRCEYVVMWIDLRKIEVEVPIAGGKKHKRQRQGHALSCVFACACVLRADYVTIGVRGSGNCAQLAWAEEAEDKNKKKQLSES